MHRTFRQMTEASSWMRSLRVVCTPFTGRIKCNRMNCANAVDSEPTRRWNAIKSTISNAFQWIVDCTERFSIHSKCCVSGIGFVVSSSFDHICARRYCIHSQTDLSINTREQCTKRFVCNRLLSLFLSFDRVWPRHIESMENVRENDLVAMLEMPQSKWN